MINEQSRGEKSAEYSWKWNSLTLIPKIKYHFHFDKTVLGVFQEYWCTKSSLELLDWMNNHCPLSGLELFRVELVVFTWLIGSGSTTSYPCLNHPEELPRCDWNLHTSSATPAALLLLFEVLRCPQTNWVCLFQFTGNLCGLSSTDTNASGTDRQNSRNTSNIDCTVSRRDHCNLRWTLCDGIWVVAGKMNFSPSSTYLHQQFITCSLQAAGP